MSKLIISADVYKRLLLFLLGNQNVSAEELLSIMRMVKASSNPTSYSQVMSLILSALLDKAGFDGQHEVFKYTMDRVVVIA